MKIEEKEIALACT